MINKNVFIFLIGTAAGYTLANYLFSEGLEKIIEKLETKLDEMENKESK